MPKTDRCAALRCARTPRRLRRAGRRLLVMAAVLAVVTPGVGVFAAPTPAQAATATPGFVNGHPSPAADVSACLSQAAGGLCVRAAEDSILPGSGGGVHGQGPSKNDSVANYKWLLNKDNTGGVTMGPDGKTPIAVETTKCHPITSTNTVGNPNYPNALSGAGPILPDGSPNPAACNWPSIHSITSSPVVSTGNQNDWNGGLPLPKASGARGLADGKYLASITSNGYQIGGGHFTSTAGVLTGLNVNTKGVLVVGLNPLPIPLANVRLKVYGDMASANGQWDEQSEFGLPNFDGRLSDYDGPVNVDYYNNPLCTAYQLTPGYDAHHFPDPTDRHYQVKLALDGRPVIDAARHIRGSFEVDGPSTGQCTSDGNGDILMPYLAPNRYGASVTTDKTAAEDPVTNTTIPAQQTCSVLSTTPDHKASAVQDQACWVQTTTLEGNHDFDAWPQANSTGYDTELLVAGELVPQVQFGFVRAGCMADPTAGTVDFNGLTGVNWLPPSDPGCATLPRPAASPLPTGAIKGQVMGANGYYPGLGALPGTGGNSGTAGYKFDRPVHHPWITLSDLNNGDKTIWASNANLDGSFQVNGVPDGSYSLAVWDQLQDYIFDSFNVTVANGKVADVGVVPLLDWWTRISGKICIDTNGNGRCDPNEAGVPKFAVQNLNRTNNAQEGGKNTVVTNDQGHYEFAEAYPLGYNDVIQAFNTRWKTTGVTWQACNDPQEHTTLTAVVDVQYNPVIAQCGRLDWAVQPYASSSTPQPGPSKPITRADNGGIVATVLYDAVRNRFLGRTQPARSFFTGIPGVLTELFKPSPKAPESAARTQVCAAATVPNVSFDGHFLNCDGAYQTDSKATTGVTNGGYATTYANGAVAATDRYNPGGATVNAYQTEHYGRGTGCVARDANGKIISGSRTAGSGNVVGTEPNGSTVTDFLPGLATDPASANPGHYTQACVEAPATGVNFSLGTDNLPLDPGVPNGAQHGVQTVDGNYALTPTDASSKPVTGDFLVKADIPGDQVLPTIDGADRPLYKVASETSMNNFADSNLDPWTPGLADHATTPQFVPQNGDLTEVFNLDGSPHATAGAPFSFPPQAGKPSQTPVATPVTGGDSPSTLVEDPNTASPSADPQCAGAAFTVKVTDPGFLSVGGSPVEGQVRNSCDVHLIHVGAGQSVAPNFYFYTDVPTPTTFIIQNFDDTNLSTSKGQTQYGDAAPIPNSPEGVYDWHGNLAYQTNVDPNGIAEALMPSTDVADCATPAGICQNVYRFVGNDPGTIDHPNVNYDPQFQTITANFQALPGVFTPADTAPIRSALAFINGGQKFTATARCGLPATTPQVFSVNRPYSDSRRDVVITGLGFGPSQGVGAARLMVPGGASTDLGITSWSDTKIVATVPAILAGAYQLRVTSAGGSTTVNGLTYHVLGIGYQPAVLEVDPSFTTEATDLPGWQAQRKFPSIQEAVERAAGYWLAPTGGTLVYKARPTDQLVNALVVVYPAAAAQQSPNNSATYSGVWYEPIIIHSAVTVQGVGPGGVIPATATTPAVSVPGTVIDGRYYFSLTDTSTAPAVIDWATAAQDVKAQHAVDVWQTVANASFPKAPAPDNQLVTEGQNVTVLGQTDQPEYTSAAHPVLDGFGLQAAITLNTPANVNAFTGQRTGPAGGADATQGGAVYLNGHDDWTRISNNMIDGNSGSYGAIRVGSPQLDGQHNWNVDIGNNQIVANGGNNLGGALALLNDSGGYRVHDNLICGNQSAEYGGGLSQYGLSVAPVSFTGTFSGNTLTAVNAANGGSTPFPFTAGDVGRSIAGPGLKGVTVASVAAGSVKLKGTVSGATGAFAFIPSAATRQTNVNLIDHNTITLNQSQDEGGGIMIAGQLPADATKASVGAGPVTISANTISVNAANDDGGGIRFLQAGTSPMRVENNIVTNNVSAHEGGGISLDDTSQVTIINDTIAKNLTTATAATSNGTPAAAGISTAHNSAPFQASLETGAKAWSDPLIVNDVIYDNRAGSWNASTSNVTGIGQTGDATPLNIWDIGIADAGPGQLSPFFSLLSTPSGAPGGEGYNASATNKSSPKVTATASNYPNFAAAIDLQLQIAPMRINFRFRSTAIVNIGLPANGVGNYRVLLASPGVVGTGTTQLLTVSPPYQAPVLAPTSDIDGNSRFGSVDAGAAQARAAL